ncbi:MAG: hypothetical protein ACE5HI_17365 [bacterium]
MAYTFTELKKKTVAQLKEMAAGMDHEAVKGYTQMNKEHLLVAICTALGIDTYEHHKVKGLDKASIKSKIKELKKERDKALKAHDHKELKAVRRQIKKLKNQLRRAMV